MNNYQIEVEYTYNGRTSWMYFTERRKNLETALNYAKKSYETRVRELGWTKYAKIVDVKEIRNANEIPPVRTIKPEPTPRKRKPSTRKPVQRRRPAPTKAGDEKPARATADTKKPRKNRRNAGRSVAGKQEKPSPSRRRSTTTRKKST